MSIRSASTVQRSQFTRVIVSDIIAKNVELAQDRLGTDGFTYRAAKIEDTDDITAGSVDMVFAANVMHFSNQYAATCAVTKQLNSGGTFACYAFGPARFHNVRLQELWARISDQRGRVLLRKADEPEATIRIMART